MFGFTIIRNASVASSGLTEAVIQSVEDVIEAAFEYWGRYIDAPNANIEIDLSFESLGANTLAEAGPQFASTGGGPWFDVVNEELSTNTDSGPFAYDGSMTINIDRINDGSFFFDTTYEPNPTGIGATQSDLLTVMAHEIGHILGFVGDYPPINTLFSDNTEEIGDDYYYIGANGVAANGGQNILLDSWAFGATGHFSGIGDLLSSTLITGNRLPINPIHIGILEDLGLTTIEESTGDDILHGFEEFDDTINGLAGNDTLFGYSGDDVLMASIGDDTLNGGIGADTLTGGTGADIFQIFEYLGNGFSDTITDFESVDTLVLGDGDFGGTFQLPIFMGENAFSNVAGELRFEHVGGETLLQLDEDGDGSTDQVLTITNGEFYLGATVQGNALELNIIASPPINGTSGDDVLIGTVDDNVINGLAGNDILDGGLGDDTLDGGLGTDTAVYSGDQTNYTITEAGGVLTIVDIVGDDDTDTLTNFEHIRFNDGTYAADSLIANNVINGTSGNEANILGTAGADIINGLAGDDFINASNGNDTLNGGNGDDILRGGAGADALNGGGGSDTASYSGTAVGVTVNLATGEATGGHAEGDVLSSIENLLGSAGADVLTGNNQINTLNGAGGDDILHAGGGVSNTLIGGQGNDTFFSGTGADFLNGGSGAEDWADYSLSTSGVTVRLNAGGTIDGGYATGDTLYAVENIVGSNYADNILTNVLKNDILAGAGDDVINAGSNNDTIDGGAGDDVILGSRGADIIDGGSGIDTASYSNSDARVVVDLVAGTATGSGHSTGDTLTNIENIFGSRYNDDIFGDDNDNVLEGFNGVDELFGRGGDDTLIGGGGIDFLNGGTGDDILTGNGGAFDRFIFDSPDFGHDHITDFHNGVERMDFRGSGISFADLLINNNGTDTVITYNDGTTDHSITLDGITSLIDAADFIF